MKLSRMLYVGFVSIEPYEIAFAELYRLVCIAFSAACDFSACESSC